MGCLYSSLNYSLIRSTSIPGFIVYSIFLYTYYAGVYSAVVLNGANYLANQVFKSETVWPFLDFLYFFQMDLLKVNKKNLSFQPNKKITRADFVGIGLWFVFQTFLLCRTIIVLYALWTLLPIFLSSPFSLHQLCGLSNLAYLGQVCRPVAFVGFTSLCYITNSYFVTRLVFQQKEFQASFLAHKEIQESRNAFLSKFSFSQILKSTEISFYAVLVSQLLIAIKGVQNSQIISFSAPELRLLSAKTMDSGPILKVSNLKPENLGFVVFGPALYNGENLLKIAFNLPLNSGFVNPLLGTNFNQPDFSIWAYTAYDNQNNFVASICYEKTETPSITRVTLVNAFRNFLQLDLHWFNGFEFVTFDSASSNEPYPAGVSDLATVPSDQITLENQAIWLKPKDFLEKTSKAETGFLLSKCSVKNPLVSRSELLDYFRSTQALAQSTVFVWSARGVLNRPDTQIQNLSRRARARLKRKLQVLAREKGSMIRLSKGERIAAGRNLFSQDSSFNECKQSLLRSVNNTVRNLYLNPKDDRIQWQLRGATLLRFYHFGELALYRQACEASNLVHKIMIQNLFGPPETENSLVERKNSKNESSYFVKVDLNVLETCLVEISRKPENYSCVRREVYQQLFPILRALRKQGIDAFLSESKTLDFVELKKELNTRITNSTKQTFSLIKAINESCKDFDLLVTRLEEIFNDPVVFFNEVKNSENQLTFYATSRIPKNSGKKFKKDSIDLKTEIDHLTYLYEEKNYLSQIETNFTKFTKSSLAIYLVNRETGMQQISTIKFKEDIKMHALPEDRNERKEKGEAIQYRDELVIIGDHRDHTQLTGLEWVQFSVNIEEAMENCEVLIDKVLPNYDVDQRIKNILVAAKKLFSDVTPYLDPNNPDTLFLTGIGEFVESFHNLGARLSTEIDKQRQLPNSVKNTLSEIREQLSYLGFDSNQQNIANNAFPTLMGEARLQTKLAGDYGKQHLAKPENLEISLCLYEENSKLETDMNIVQQASVPAEAALTLMEAEELARSFQAKGEIGPEASETLVKAMEVLALLAELQQKELQGKKIESEQSSSSKKPDNL